LAKKDIQAIARNFIPLPLGSVMPSGWLKEQLKIQATGLSGHLDEVWPKVSDENGWLGGTGDSWEAGPYYMDGLIPLAFLTKEPQLIVKAEKWVNWAVGSLKDDGWFGPQTDNPDIWWPRAVALKALTQYADATGDKRIEQLLAGFFVYMMKKLPEKPLTGYGRFRWGEFLPSLFWLCEKRPCPVFEQLLPMLHSQGFDWSDHFNFFTIENKVRNNPNKATHVVNHAMAIKYPALWSLISMRKTDRTASDNALAMLDRFHGCATGLFTGDEHLAGLNPSQGTELCAVVEEMFSLETLAGFFGDASYSDRLESIAYNNLPAAFTADMWAHQYDQQANQVLCSVAKRDWSNGEEANIFGLSPHWYCCTANFHQGWPKFISNLWMKTKDGGLAAVAYGPSEVETLIDGKKVKIIEKTDYPFSGNIELELFLDAPAQFPVSLRIPSWAEGAEIKINKEKQMIPKPGAYQQFIRTWKKGDRVSINLPMKVRTSKRYNDGISVHRGPLAFALRIGSSWKIINGKAPAADYEVTPLTKWNYALVTDKAHPEKTFGVKTKNIKMPCFSEENSPVTISVKARELPAWGMDGASAAPPPKSPVTATNPIEKVELIPYGAAKLRITEFPVSET